MEEVNFKVIQGDTFTITVSYKNPDGTSINLGDFTAKMDVRDKPNGKVLCASATEANGGITINDNAGTITVKFTPAQTRKFSLPTSSHQLKIIDESTGNQTTLVYGHLSVSAAVIK